MTQYTRFSLPAIGAALLGLSACIGPAVPRSFVDEPVLDRLSIGFSQRTEKLEVALDPQNGQLTQVDRNRLRGFVRAYKDHGHGPLNMVLPESTLNQQSAVSAVAEARAIAYENGVEYTQIAGGAQFSGRSAMVLSFVAYDAVAPECKGFGEVDFTAIRSNAEASNLGCSVRTNIAAMIADPADLLGTRPLDETDAVRRQAVFELYRDGEQTASERNDGESGVVSDAVDSQ